MAEEKKRPRIEQLLLADFGESPDEAFREISRELFTKWSLRCCEKSYVLAELEFYLSTEAHPDPYVHKSTGQSAFGKWYFHRASSAKIGFTLKGVDLTFGGPGKHGGILIRAIRSIVEGKLGPIIEGPSKVVDAILTDCEVTSVSDLLTLEAYISDAFDCPHVMLAPTKGIPRKIVLAAGTRIGLRDRPKDSVATAFHKKSYRFHAYPTMAKKEKRKLEPVAD